MGEMESLRVAQEVSSGLGCGGLASKVVSKSGCVSVSSAACVSGAGYHCGSGLKLQSSSSQVKANGASKLGSALWGSSVVLSSASDEVKVAQRSVSARASVEAPDAPAKTSIVRSADTAGAVRFLLLICIINLLNSPRILEISFVRFRPPVAYEQFEQLCDSVNSSRVWTIEEFPLDGIEVLAGRCCSF